LFVQHDNDNYRLTQGDLNYYRNELTTQRGREIAPGNIRAAVRRKRIHVVR
jgi:hypothetical protein